MDERIERALREDRLFDLTTTGRASGQPRRVEMWFHNLDGQIYITGTPGRRDWYANMVARPDFTFHLKDSVTADLAARAHPITDPATRRDVIGRILANLGRSPNALDAWVADSPLVAVTFLDV